VHSYRLEGENYFGIITDHERGMPASFRSKSGGSNGATMRFDPESNWGANAGLTIARRLLEPIKAKYPGKVGPLLSGREWIVTIR